MAGEFRQCKQCGKMLPITSFRKYYGGRKGTYKYCLNCERINSREKYLMKKDTISADETNELAQIHKLWDVQRMNGLQPPHHNKNKQSVIESVDSLLSDYNAVEVLSEKANNGELPLAPATEKDCIPAELQKWLTVELTKEPDYYQDVVYEELREKYRPVLEIDQDTLMPVYDDTYKYILNEILERFDNYEDNYEWNEED